MIARLSLYPPFRPARQCLLERGKDYLIGRGGECDFALEDDRISRQHARVSSTESGWQLVDLGSKNGTSVDGCSIADATPLRDASWLSFGGLPGRFELLSERARQEAELSRLERWQTTVTLERRLASELGPEALIRRYLESVLELSGAERGFVLLTRPDGDLEIAASAGLGAEDLASPAFSGSVGAVERVLANGEPAVVSDAQLDPGLVGRASIVAAAIRGLICLPLTVRERLLGVLYVDSRKPGVTFTELDVEILQTLTSHAAMALSVARIERDLKRLAAVVGGEGALSGDRRRRLQHELETVWDRAVQGAGAEPAPAAHRGSTTWHAIVAAHRDDPGIHP